MDAPMSFSAPRRKLATYGKPSRKRVDGYHLENQHPRSDASGKDSRLMAGQRNESIDRSVLCVINTHFADRATNKTAAVSGKALNKPATAAKVEPQQARRKMRTDNVVRGSSPSKQAKPTDDLRVFDFVSSDDDGEDETSTLLRPSRSHQSAVPARPGKPPGRPGPSVVDNSGRGERKVALRAAPSTPSRKRKLGTYLREEHQSDAFGTNNAQGRLNASSHFRSSSTHRDEESTEDSMDSRATKSPSTTSRLQETVKRSVLTSIMSGDTPGSHLRLQKGGNLSPGRKKWSLQQGSTGDAPATKNSPSPGAVRRRSSSTNINGNTSETTMTPSPRPKTTMARARTPPQASGLRRNGEPTATLQPTQHLSPSRKTDLWDKLLEGDIHDSDPNTLPLNRLGLSPYKSKEGLARRGNAAHHGLQFAATNDRTDGGHRRRLIDSLTTTGRNQINDDPTEGCNSESSGIPEAKAPTQFSQSSVMMDCSQEEPALMNSYEGGSSDSRAASQSNASQSILNSQPVGLKVTYARQRSFLSEESLDDELLLHRPLEVQVSPSKPSRRMGGMGASIPALPLRSLVEEQENVGNGHSVSIKSIHELREAGYTKRFIDEFEGMLEDISDRSISSTSKRRINLLELATKLFKKPNARRFLDLSLDRRLFNQLDTEQDVISGCVLASTLALLSREGLTTHSLLYLCEQGAPLMLTRLLHINQDIVLLAKDRRHPISKATQSLIAAFGALVRQFPIWPKPPEQLSPRVLALTALEIVVRCLREAGDTCHRLSFDTIGTIVSTVGQIPAWSSEGDLSGQEMFEIETGLSILEACTMNPGLTFGNSPHENTWTTTVMSWLLFVVHNPANEWKPIQLSVLRLVLNITNNTPALSERLASPAVIRALTHVIHLEFGRQVDSLDGDSVDQLILGLATMINLVESSSKVHEHLLGFDDDGTSFLDLLLQPFLQGLEKTAEADSMEETHFNVAIGYLAVLLGNLCLHEEVKPQIRSRLPGQTIRPIQHAAVEFLQYHKEVDAQLSESDHRGRSSDGFTEKLQKMIERLLEV